jgi:hypothetical protein
MKTILLTLGIFILISSSLFGQLKIDAGNDTILCVGVWGVDTTEIGGNPTASGGTEPYTYSWETNYTIGSNSFGASYFLDDSTKANPKIVNDAEQDLEFILTVSDNSNNIRKDTVDVKFSRYYYTLVDYGANINQGDTVTLAHNIGLGIEPLSFAWSPNYNISDTTISNPKAWPGTDTDYKVFATDSIGCISEPDIFEINVTPVGILENKETDFKSVVFPNPVDVNSKIYLFDKQHSDFRIKVINAKGQLILSDKMDSDSYQIGNKINQTGLYIYMILNKDELISSGQIVKK